MAQKIVAFARGIIFARLLGTAEYGIYTLAFFLILITVSITSLGIPASFGRYAPRYQPKGALRWFFRKAYTLNITLSAAVAAVILLRPSFFSNLIYGDSSHVGVVMVAAAGIVGFVVLTNIVHSFSGLKLFRASSVSQFAQVAIYGGAGIVFILLYGSATSALLAYVLSIVLTIVVFVPVLSRYLRSLEGTSSSLDEPGFYKHLLRFTIWFAVAPIMLQVFNYVDRLSLQRLMSSSDQGIYSAAVNLSLTISAIGLAVNNVIFPHLSTTWERGNKEKALRNLDLSIRVTSIGLVIVGLLLVLLGRLVILLLLGREYLPGADVLPFLVVFYLFNMSVWLFGVYPSLIERTYVSAIGLVCALPANVVLNLVLIPHLGIVGAGLATMASYILMWCIVVGICRAFGMPVGRRLVVVSLLPLVLLLPKIAATAAVVLVIYICIRTPWILSDDERQRVFTQLGGFIRRRRQGA
jgi:O-antigen/teichoic acid export membrane protein